jgi:hypothetical protein
MSAHSGMPRAKNRDSLVGVPVTNELIHSYIHHSRHWLSVYTNDPVGAPAEILEVLRVDVDSLVYLK